MALADITALAALVLAAIWGGWEWTVPCLIVCVALRRQQARVRPLMAAIAPGLLWLALYAWTGDRRLFFCYSMQYAVQFGCLGMPRGRWRGFAAASVVVAIFVAIRIAQGASTKVLLVEIAVAAAVLAISLALHGTGAPNAGRRLTAAAAGSLLAFAGLAL